MKELEAARAAKAQLALYDAVPSAGVAESGSVDSEVAKFLPLLQDYLKRMPCLPHPATPREKC